MALKALGDTHELAQQVLFLFCTDLFGSIVLVGGGRSRTFTQQVGVSLCTDFWGVDRSRGEVKVRRHDFS
jgi:hypothetical protein